MIWAVVLAAGESRRMGTQKLLLPFGDATVVEAVVRTALASRVDRALVVLGADRDAVRLKLEPRPASRSPSTRTTGSACSRPSRPASGRSRPTPGPP